MKKTGNLFALARKRLEKKKVKFTLVDVIDKAIEIRRKLDEQEVIRQSKAFKKWYLKKKSNKK